MANNNNSLYLPLKINLDEFEKSLTEANVDLQKAMKKMKSSVTDLKFRYDVDIASAKAIGDTTKVLELENRKLNQVYDTQKQALEALNRAYEASAKAKGKDAEETKNLAKQLVYQSKEVEKAKRQLDANSLNFGKKLSDGLASVSPEFAKIRTLTANFTGELSKLGGVAITASKAVAGIAIPASVLAMGVAGLRKLVHSYKETAEASANANEEVYQLREVLNSSYQEAELLAGAARIDGVSLDALGSSINMLYKNISQGNEKGKRAIAILEQYGATITDINGNRIGTIDMFKELQNAYANAEMMGKGRDLLTALFGGSSDQFLHFIKGFDYYLQKAEEVQAVNEKEYQLSHDLLDIKKQQQEAERQLQAVRGDAFLAGAVETQKVHNAGIKEQIKLYEDAKESLKGYSQEMKNLAIAEEGANLAWEKFMISLKNQGMKTFDTAWKSVKNLANAYSDLKESIPAGKLAFDTLENLPGIGFALKQLSIAKSISDEEKRIEEQMIADENQAEIDAMQNRIDEEDRLQKQKARDRIVQQKKEAEANAKTLEEQKKKQEQFYKELRDLQSSDYEREINQLNDRKKAWEEANVNIVDIEKRYAEEKAQIDKKYYDKQEKERQDNLKKAQEAYKKEVEEAKKARESQIDDAQSTIKNGAKLLSYIRKQKEAGTYNEEDVKKYADKLSLKSQGLKQSQIDTAYEIGIDKLKEFLDSRNRIFGKFTGTNGINGITGSTDTIGFNQAMNQAMNQVMNQYQQQQPIPQAPQVSPQVAVTVNFDNVVVEDQGAIQRIADKVADTITPVVESALRGGANYGY